LIGLKLSSTTLRNTFCDMWYLLLPIASFLTITAIGIGFGIGINALVKAEKTKPRVMIIGNLIYTLGLGGYLISTAARFQHSSESMLQLMTISSLLLLLGLFIFSIGFALHGTRANNRGSRIEELELMNLAQATELERLRNR
jgi:hypothetical protein